MVSRVTFTKAPAPERPSKIKAQQQANRVDIDRVLQVGKPRDLFARPD